MRYATSISSELESGTHQPRDPSPRLTRNELSRCRICTGKRFSTHNELRDVDLHRADEAKHAQDRRPADGLARTELEVQHYREGDLAGGSRDEEWHKAVAAHFVDALKRAACLSLLSQHFFLLPCLQRSPLLIAEAAATKTDVRTCT